MPSTPPPPISSSSVMSSGGLTFGHIMTLAKSHWMNRHCPSIRQLLLEFTALVGQLAAEMLQHAPPDRTAALSQSDVDTTTTTTSTTTPTKTSQFSIRKMKKLPNEPVPWKAPTIMYPLFGQLLWQLALMAVSCDLHLHHCIVTKLQLNAKKYPVELCHGKSGKYTQYSHQTGITKTSGQETPHIITPSTTTTTTTTTTFNPNESFTQLDTLEHVQSNIAQFATERQWNRFHTPRNLVLALLGELGELSELMQWKGDTESLSVTRSSKDNTDLEQNNNNNNNVESNNNDIKNESNNDNHEINNDHQVYNQQKELASIGQELADVTIYLLRLATVCHVPLSQSTLKICANQMMTRNSHSSPKP